MTTTETTPDESTLAPDHGAATAPASSPAARPGDAAIRAAIAKGARPSPASPLGATFTLGWRAMLKIKHVPEQLFDVTAFPIMFTLMFTYLFGGALAGSPREYLQFVLPGILVQTVIFITMYTGMTLNTDIEKGVFDRFRSLPIWRPAVLAGAMLGDVARYGVAASVSVGLGLILGYRPQGGFVGVVLGLALLLLFAFSVGWIFTALGMVLRSPQAVLSVSMMVLFPLTFTTNIFVDPDTMPSWMKAIVEANPISHLTTAVRGLMGGDVDSGEVAYVLVASGILLAVFGPLTMRLFKRER
jgi:ABC-2 type transport system permease protein